MAVCREYGRRPAAGGQQNRTGRRSCGQLYLSMNIFARDKVLYDGHAVAAVAAVDRHTAEEALRLIEVEYEVLPPVMTIDQATRPDAPIVLEDLRN
jgi:xanthine dehydrogenase molybdenum-binding subunit